MWIFFNKLLHKKHSLLVPDQHWTTRMVTTLKADCSSSDSLNPSANGAVRNTVGSTYICQTSMVLHAVISQFHLREHRNQIAQLWDPYFSGTVDDITFLITSNNHMTDDVNTILSMVIGYGLTFLLVEVLMKKYIQFLYL